MIHRTNSSHPHKLYTNHCYFIFVNKKVKQKKGSLVLKNEFPIFWSWQNHYISLDKIIVIGCRKYWFLCIIRFVVKCVYLIIFDSFSFCHKMCWLNILTVLGFDVKCVDFFSNNAFVVKRVDFILVENNNMFHYKLSICMATQHV